MDILMLGVLAVCVLATAALLRICRPPEGS